MNKFSFELSSVISKVLVAEFDHVSVCWERYRINIPVPRIIETLTQETNPYSKLETGTLKQDVKSAKS